MQVRAACDEIKKMRYSLARIRAIEEAVAYRYSEQKMRCPVHLSIGQEAIAVGVCHFLAPTDYVVSGHRAHAHYLAKGGDLKRMIAELYGKQTGCARGRGGSMHLVDLSVGFLGSTPILGGTLPIGVGAAFGTILKKEKRVTTIFFGDGATEEGIFSECLNFAVLKKLPVLFVCENNFYSVNSPLSVRQPGERKIYRVAESHGCRAFFGDGNNLEEVKNLTKTALDHIKEGKGPAFLEFVTCRFKEHCGPQDDPFFTREELAFFKEKDPLKECRIEMTSITKEIEEAFAFAEASPFPSPCEGSVYA